jgi:hypothetical protein
MKRVTLPVNCYYVALTLDAHYRQSLVRVTLVITDGQRLEGRKGGPNEAATHVRCKLLQLDPTGAYDHLRNPRPSSEYYCP